MSVLKRKWLSDDAVLQYWTHKFKCIPSIFWINYTLPFFYFQNYNQSSMSAHYSKGKVDVIETEIGPKDARYKTISNVEKFKTRLTKFPRKWIMLIGVIAIVVAVVVVTIVVTVHRKGERIGIRNLYLLFLALQQMHVTTIASQFNVTAARRMNNFIQFTFRTRTYRLNLLSTTC